VTGAEWTLPLSFSRPPLSLNDSPTTTRGARMARAAKVKRIREEAAVRARAAGIPRLERFTAVLHYQPRDNRPRDGMNLYATFKPLIDGLIDAGVCVDDDRAHFHDTAPEIHDARRGEAGRMWLIVRDLSDERGVQIALDLTPERNTARS
jgi:crossover junction endodeoxyribonuclease RusA